MMEGCECAISNAEAFAEKLSRELQVLDGVRAAPAAVSAAVDRTRGLVTLVTLRLSASAPELLEVGLLCLCQLVSSCLKDELGAEEMAQWLKHLPCKLRTRVQTPRPQVNTWGIVVLL